MQTNQATTQELIEVKHINKESLQQLLTENNWDLNWDEYLRENNHKNISISCNNLNEASCIKTIYLNNSFGTPKHNYDCTIAFTAEGTRQLFKTLKLTENNYYLQIRNYFKHIMEVSTRLQNTDDINNAECTLYCNLQDVAKEDATCIYNFIQASGNDISNEMWNKLVEILPFREKSQTELALTIQLENYFAQLAVVKFDTEFEVFLENIINISKQLSEIQPTESIFYTTAERLAILGFGEQAVEILEQTILFDISSPFYDDASKLAINITLNKHSNNSGDKRKFAQEAIKYLMRSDTNNISDLKHKLSVLGKSLGNENFFYHLLPDEYTAGTIEELSEDIFIQVITQMTETIYSSNQTNQELKDENQQLRERVSRLEAELAQHTMVDNSITLTAYDNYSATNTINSQSNSITTEIENKTSAPNNAYS